MLTISHQMAQQSLFYRDLEVREKMERHLVLTSCQWINIFVLNRSLSIYLQISREQFNQLINLLPIQ